MKDKTITKLQDYLDWFQELQKTDSLFPLKNLFFRGHSQQSWKLEPSLYRGNFDEADILNQAKMRGWSYLKDCKSNLDLLITLQHYGLPTRLLDVTMNPLVALYFACQKGEEIEDGCVFWGWIGNTDDREFAEMAAHILFMSSSSQSFLTKKQCKYLKTAFSNCDLNKSYREVFATPLFFFPAQNNPRIIAQSGAFLMSGLINLLQSDSKNIAWANKDGCDSSIKKLFQNSRAIIPSDVKEELLQNLDLCGINQASLFPDLQNLTAYIKNKYEMFKGYKLDVSN